MAPLTQQLCQNDSIIDLEKYIESLLRQKELLSDIEQHSSGIDFADVQDAYALLVGEIERLQAELREQSECFVFEEEEEESSSGKYNIAHVIADGDGCERKVKPGDLDIETNKGVRDAFKVLYEIQKQGVLYDKCEKEDAEQGDYKKGEYQN